VPLPDEVHVRISSEDAGSITVTPVVHQTMPLNELVAAILSTTGKDRERVRDILHRGAVVQGGSRLRWQPIEADAAEVETLLAGFPSADPSRAFTPERCIGVRLRAGRHVVELPRDIAAQRRFLRRSSFWDALLELADRAAPQYMDYSFRTRTDEYRVRIAPNELDRLRVAARLLRYSGLSAQIESLAVDCIEYSVRYP
jgi:hypothetical protein